MRRVGPVLVVAAVLAALLALTGRGAVHASDGTAGNADPGVVSTPHGRAVAVRDPDPAGAPGRVLSTDGPVQEVSLGTRDYLLAVPPDATGRRPLVVLLHGTNVSARTMMGFSGLQALALRDRFLLAAPESVGPTWNSDDGCCDGPARHHLDDVGFVVHVVADVRAREPVDPARIYLVGYSAGGKLSYDVACALPGTFAATATYGAGPQLDCAAPRPHAVFVGYGRDDHLEPLAGKPHNARGAHPPAADTVAAFRALDRCGPRPSVRTVGPAELDTWSCAGGTAVQYVRWAGQTHHFPTAPQTPAAATAATLMWAFFQQHPLSGGRA